MTEESRDDRKEQAEEDVINNNDRMQVYIGSFANAASAKEGRIQETTTAASTKDPQMAEIIARMEARDETRNAQMRLKGKQIGDLINKLTSMSTSGTYNNGRNTKWDRDESGGGGGGTGGGSSTDKYAEGPKYLLTFKAADGGAKRMDWKKKSSK